ncbi:MAG: FtsQ-type POTRA domain-containing protein [Bacillota bacterium]
MLRGGASILIIFLLAAVGAWFFLQSPSFRLDSVIVEGAVNMESREIEDLLDLDGGTHLYSISLTRLRDRICADPRVESASIHRVVPGSLRIEVEERRPVAVVLRSGIFAEIDDAGRIIEVHDSWPGLALPLITGVPTRRLQLGERALDEECAELEVALHLGGIRGEIEEIRSEDLGIVLITSGGGEIWLSDMHGDMVEGLEVLTSAQTPLPGPDCVHDYRLPERPVRKCDQ